MRNETDSLPQEPGAGHGPVSESSQSRSEASVAYMISFSMSERYAPFIGRPGGIFKTRDDPELPIIELGFGYHVGQRYDPAKIYDEYYLGSGHKYLPDIFSIQGYWGCCFEFRDMVEELEPGVHQFFPVRKIVRPNSKKPVIRLDGRPADNQFFILNCLQLIDCVIPEKSSGAGFRKPGSMIAGEYNPNVFFTNDNDVCLSKEKIAGKHLWRGKTESLYAGYYLISDELMARIKAAKLKGYYATHFREE
jgi:hypothetical protein